MRSSMCLITAAAFTELGGLRPFEPHTLTLILLIQNIIYLFRRGAKICETRLLDMH